MDHLDHTLDNKHNTSRYFVEKRQVAWAVLLGVLAWGFFGYLHMPQRKDPEIPVRETVAIAHWPGIPAGRVEELLTKPVEQAMAKNTKVTEIRSITRDGVAYVYAKLDEAVDDTAKELDDLRLKLDALQLPAGAQPVELVKDFGDTATLMLTVASPRVDEADLALRAQQMGRTMQPGRIAIFFPHARSLDATALARLTGRLADWLSEEKLLAGPHVLQGSGFIGFDAVSTHSPSEISAALKRLMEQRLRAPELQPDIWQPIVVRTSPELPAALTAVAGAKYSYRELDRFTEQIEKTLKTLGVVGRVNRSGLMPEQVELTYSQDRLGGVQLDPATLRNALASRSSLSSSGGVDTSARAVTLASGGDFQDARQIGDVLIPSATRDAPPARLSELVDVERGYQSPARFMNFHQWRDEHGHWQRARAITLDIQMRSGEQIGHFSQEADRELNTLLMRLPADLIVHRTSDQPLQVTDNVQLFMGSLWEAIALVVLVSWIGFWEWRPALVMALAIPVTLAMTFGMMALLGLDLQQISIASLIIALGLLVDDPVVAGDAIKRELAAGRSRLFAAWQGPTRLARAILFATVTNIVSYLPFLLLKGDNRRFLFTLPVVMTCALVASRLVSMTFIPLLGYYLLREHREPSLAQRRRSGFGAFYYRVGSWAIEHRWRVLAGAGVLLALSFAAAGTLKQQFFPYERQYLSFVDVWLPQDSPVSATSAATAQAEAVLRDVANQYGREHHRSSPVLKSLTSWVGGGAPRYWLSSNPEPQLPNYGHILTQVADKEDTGALMPLWQGALNARISGATVDVRRLETSAPIGVPVAIRLSGNDLTDLRGQAASLKQILKNTGLSARVRDDWGEDALAVRLEVNNDKASLAGLSERDVTDAAAGALEGVNVGSMHELDHTIPIVLRLRMDERANLSDLSNLYVYSPDGATRTPLTQVAQIAYRLQPARIARYQQFRTITVSSFPLVGHLPSELLMAAMPQIKDLQTHLPSGVRLEIAGEYKEQMKGFGQLAVVMLISVLSIFFALVVQFRSAVKPLIVFAAIPFGIGGALTGLAVMGEPFGFMAFLGIASLIGVIVSHIIVLFDFIEEKHAEGEPLQQALLDAGILRLRPVLITVAATVTAFIPLAAHGGPLWEPLCYAQIAGLLVSTTITLLLVPVVYAVFVMDLKWVRWELAPETAHPPVEAEYYGELVSGVSSMKS
ncbi:MAG TPA: efflux RND transporter permease subunit [Bryobacteraceae bacterium]|nr:efflux RND transporter permease subunit [Bryobacteraceae bacterium]